MVQHLFDHLLPRGQEKEADRSQSLEGLLEATASTACSTSRSRPTCAAAASAWRRTACRPAAASKMPARTTCWMPLHGLPEHYRETGMDALAAGAVAVVSLAGGVGSRWTKGAGVVKALNPFSQAGRPASQLHRSAPGQEPARGPRQRQ